MSCAFFWHADGIEHFVDRIGAGADIVAVLLDHHRRLDDAVAFVGVFLRRTRIVGKLKESFGRKPASGDFLFHFVDERLDAEGHRNVQLLLAGDHAVCLGDGRPLDLVGHAERVEKRPHVAAVVGGTEVVELVQRRLELETTSAEAGRKSAGQIVLFDDKHFRAALKQPDRRHETAVSGAYDYCIIFVHMFLLIVVILILYTPIASKSISKISAGSIIARQTRLTNTGGIIFLPLVFRMPSFPLRDLYGKSSRSLTRCTFHGA